MASIMTHSLGGQVASQAIVTRPHIDNSFGYPCLFNLVVYCQDVDRMAYFQQLIQTTIAYFPCCIALIYRCERQNTPIASTTFLSSTPEDSSPKCEQLLIQASGKDLYQVPFLVLPFIQSDLPLFLIWDCDPTADQAILPALQAHANRLIFDSETIDHLQRFSHHLLAYMQTHTHDIVDLNWTRIGGWREIIGKIFDTQERVEQLRSAREICITYNALENRFFHHSQTQAIYLQAWLAAQLDWPHRFLGTSHGKSEVGYGHDLIVTLQPAKIEERSPGSIFSLEVIQANGQTVAARRNPGSQQVTVEASSDKSCTLPFTLNLRGTQLSYAVLKEILYLYGSEHYRRMLHILKSQDWNREHE